MPMSGSTPAQVGCGSGVGVTPIRAMLEDPDFVAECDKRKLPIEGAAGEEVDTMARETLALPRPVLDKIGEMMR